MSAYLRRQDGELVAGEVAHRGGGGVNVGMAEAVDTGSLYRGCRLKDC